MAIFLRSTWVGLLVLIGCTFLLSGCSFTGAKKYINIEKDTLDNPHPTKARIHIKRKGAFAGGGVTTRVVDSGTGIEKTYLLVEKKPTEQRRSSSGNNVALIEGKEGLVFGKQKYIDRYKEKYGEDWREQALQRKYGDTDIGAHYTKYIGILDNGGLIVWDRNPGKMKIEVVDGYGWQTSSSPITVEAGKDYYIFFEFLAPLVIRAEPFN